MSASIPMAAMIHEFDAKDVAVFMLAVDKGHVASSQLVTRYACKRTRVPVDRYLTAKWSV